MEEKSNCTFNISGGNVQMFPNATTQQQIFYGDELAKTILGCKEKLNANGGHKISAITLMGTSPEAILSEVE